MLGLLPLSAGMAPSVAHLQGAASQRAVSPMMNVQGGSLRTYPTYGDQVEVGVSSDGRPVDANIELWQGPGNTPFSMRVSGEDGYHRPISAVIPRGGAYSGTMAVRNTGPMEFPMRADVWGSDVNVYHPSPALDMHGQTIQGGGALRTYTFDGAVDTVQVMLKSEGLPIYATAEVLQGPNSNRQTIELYTDDGHNKPILYTMETPGYGTTISITNTGPMEYPLTASVVPVAVRSYDDRGLGMSREFGGGRYRQGGRYAAPPRGGAYGNLPDDRGGYDSRANDRRYQYQYAGRRENGDHRGHLHGQGRSLSRNQGYAYNRGAGYDADAHRARRGPPVPAMTGGPPGAYGGNTRGRRAPFNVREF